MLSTTITSIQALNDFKPSPQVNELFTTLVQEIVAAPSTLTIESRTTRSIQKIASAAETEMELFWAQKIIESETPQITLTSFPYCNNYRELIRREIELVEKSGLSLASGSRVLMIGTGPLPMTGLELMAQRRVSVDHVDSSLTAIAVCSLVSSRLGLACGHLLGDGASVALKNSYDLIIVAALAGETPSQKQAIINNSLSSLARNGRMLLRSAYGPRTLLYPGIPANAFSGVTLLEEYHPQDDIINSVFVYKKEQL